jgi:uncharacterized protein (DUF1778 family)
LTAEADGDGLRSSETLKQITLTAFMVKHAFEAAQNILADHRNCSARTYVAKREMGR